ncbi:MAG TPA: hypothetical protein VMZ22_09995 [Acidimicrobiales bacterium]|nr:hypothetical protein [Acidimicrobiales bacterium]
MRTTLSIDDSLLKKAKREAARTGKPLGAIVDDALRVLFAGGASRRPPVRLETDGGSGVQPGVDLEDKDALADLLDRRDADR